LVFVANEMLLLRPFFLVLLSDAGMIVEVIHDKAFIILWDWISCSRIYKILHIFET